MDGPLPATATYTVVDNNNDTLWQIAADHGITLAELLQLNPQFDPTKVDGRPSYGRPDAPGTWDPDFIKPGDTIVVPGANGTSSTGPAADHGDAPAAALAATAGGTGSRTSGTQVVQGRYITSNPFGNGLDIALDIKGDEKYDVYVRTADGLKLVGSGTYTQWGHRIEFNQDGPMAGYGGVTDKSKPGEGSLVTLRLTGSGQFGGTVHLNDLRLQQ